MLRTTKNMKEKYEKIQNYLFDLIPEKWDEIYLYASIIDRQEETLTGEMFFYYIPKGILKKKPINVYEVPKRFNINETEYLKIVDNLYQIIKDLRKDFIDTEQELWTNLTISIANSRFRVEYGYEKISQEERASYIRHVIWRYNYLGIGGELKDERKVLDEYFSKKLSLEPKKELYQTGLYLKTVNNVVGYDREIEIAKERKKEQEEKQALQEKKKEEKKDIKRRKIEEKRMKEQERHKNQILK